MTYRAAGAMDEASGGRTEPKEVMAAIEEYAIEASIMKVAGSEWMFEIIDDMLQVHGGNGFVTDYPIERAYRDNRVNRIFEGTNEINRLLIPGMIFKRAIKGEMPLMEAVMRLTEDLSDPRHFPARAGLRSDPHCHLRRGARTRCGRGARAARAFAPLHARQHRRGARSYRSGRAGSRRLPAHVLRLCGFVHAPSRESARRLPSPPTHAQFSRRG